MVRLSILSVLVIGLVGQMECGSSAGRRYRQNRAYEMYKPILNELLSIKVILETIKDQNVMAATMQLNKAQQEDIQQALCPECGEYEVCNETTVACELRGCDQELDLVNEIADEYITASSYLDSCSKCLSYYGPQQSRLNSSKAWQPKTQSSDEYLQFEFPDMKIVQAIVIVKFDYSGYTTSYNVTTSTDCIAFTSTLPIFDVGDKDNVTSTFQHPVLARCVRVLAANWTGSYINMKIGLLGCKAEST